MQNSSKIICPKCGTEIDVQNVLADKIEQDIKKNYESIYAESKRKFDDQSLALEKSRIEFENTKKKEEALIQERVEKLARNQEKQIEAKLKIKIESEKADEVEMLQKELNEKSVRLKELNKSKAEISKLKREKDELRDSIVAETQATLSKKLSEEKIKIRDSEHKRVELLQKELNEKSEQLKELNKSKAEISKLKREKDELRDSIVAETQEALSKQLSEEKIKIRNSEHERVEMLQKELDEKSEQLKELNKSKAEISKLKREKDELRDSIVAETQAMLNKELSEEKIKIRNIEHEKNEMAIKELEKKLSDQKKLTEEMQRKQEQGSMQLQGEVQELAIEEWLADKFPLDNIEEIKKGARGGDCIQTIHTRTKQNCGTIYYESKRTKDFQPSWIEKFKNDIRNKNANIAVLVTEAMPSDMERMGQKEGIWICTYEEFKGLCVVLRESIVQLSDALVSQENKGDKMTMLYDFLTSNEFRLQIEGIVEGFTQMKADLETEKRSIMGHWKKREKQIDKVVLNTNFMYNSIKGIAGNAIKEVKALEIPDPNPELDF